jgi:cytochrome P450
MSNVDIAEGSSKKPAHVPQAAVFDFDMFRDSAYLADPHERSLELLKTAPHVFWTPRNGGHWMFLSYDANSKAARDTKAFSNEFVSKEQMAALQARMPVGSPRVPIPVPLNLDPPEHAKYRGPLQRAFSPSAIAELKGAINQFAGELIDSVKSRGHCDVIAEIARLLPVKVFLTMMGLPLEHHADYLPAAKEANFDADPMRIPKRLLQITGHMREVFLARRDNPQSDVISLLWNSQIDGRAVSLDDMENYGVLLYIAALDTVTQGIGFGIRHLARNADLQVEMRENPRSIPAISEELLRRYAFTVPGRRVTKDIVFEGHCMKEGDWAILFLPAANLDSAEFPDPEQIKPDRKGRAHLAFNAGPHHCLGLHLARIQLHAVYEQMLLRLPEFRLDSEHPPTFHTGNVIGFDALEVVWNT